MYSYEPSHMAKQKQDDQLEHTYSSYVRIRDVALKTCQRRWTIGRSGERGSGISVLAALHDDDDWLKQLGCPLVSVVSASAHPVGRGFRIHQRYNCRRVRPSPTSVLGRIPNFIWWWGSSPGAFGNVEYSFTA